MASNFFFNNFQSSQEQLLLESLVIESIKIYGHDVMYIPRNVHKLDKVYVEDPLSFYNVAIPIEMYIKSIDGFRGDGNFMSKFGLEIRDQVVFSVAQRTFFNEIGSDYAFQRPREGDLIWFPLNSKLFQIRFVNKFEMFYQLGILTTWEMTCELFEYSDEDIDTGIPDIDRIQQRLSTNMIDFGIMDENNNYIMDEDGDYLIDEKYDLERATGYIGENDTIEGESDNFIDFSVRDPFSEGNI